MEFLNSNTDYDGNRRLDEGNDITCILSNFGGAASSQVTRPEWEQPTSVSVEIGDTHHMMMQPKCLSLNEPNSTTRNNITTPLSNEISTSFISQKEMLQEKTSQSLPTSEETGTSEFEPESLFKGLVEVCQKSNHRGGGKGPVGGKWKEDEDSRLRFLVNKYGPKCWRKIASMLGDSRSDVQCLHRWNKVLRPGLQKGPWTQQEDAVVLSMVNAVGLGKVQWNSVASMLSGRLGKQCRERWVNYLDPNIKRDAWTDEENNILFEAQRHLGNRWCEIVKLLPGRPENTVKNRFNSSARMKWHTAHPVGSKSTISPKLMSALRNVYEQNHKVVWERQEQQKVTKKAAISNIWSTSTYETQPTGSRKETEDYVNLPGISCATEEISIGQASKQCHHHQQHINQLQSDHSYGSIELEGGNNAEVVAAGCAPNFPPREPTGGMYTGGIENLNIHTTKMGSVDSIASEVNRNMALNMMYSAQQQPLHKKHKRDGSDESLMSETTMSCFETQAYDHDTERQHLYSKRLRSESFISTGSETSSINEVARRAGVFTRGFVPLTLLPYFKYLNDEAKHEILSQLSEEHRKPPGTLQPNDSCSSMLQQQVIQPEDQKDGHGAYHQIAMPGSSLPDNSVQDQVDQMDTHTVISI